MSTSEKLGTTTNPYVRPEGHKNNSFFKITGLRDQRFAASARPEFIVPWTLERTLSLLVVVGGLIYAATTICSKVGGSSNGLDIFGGGFVIATVAIVLSVILNQASKPKEEQARKRWNADVLAKWQAASEKWARLYYCQRNDIVVDPQDGTYAPAGQMLA